jgi:hypothetical protein
MIFDSPAIIADLAIPVYQFDPPSQSFTSPGLIWYNTTLGTLRYTYNLTGSDSLYCVTSTVTGCSVYNNSIITI